ncbi:uncharacterized protein (UPF0335 family) [Rhizobium pisi]
MAADKQLKAYIDRVLRLKEEQDTIGDDIREIYAEAKAEGYDKTVMGKLVAHLRKVLKQGDGAVAEAESIFDTYLHAYQRASGTPVATHTHEEEFDPLTGEIFEDINPRLAKQVVDGMQTEAGRAALIAAVDILIEQEETAEGFQAKASGDNGATVQAKKVPADSVTGDVSRPSRGGDTPASNSDPVANVEEDYADESAASSADPASRTSEESERQRASTVGFADDCRTGGKEQMDSSAAPVGDAGAYAEGIPADFNRPAYLAVPGGEPSIPSPDAGGEKIEKGSNPSLGRSDVKSAHSSAESERATNTNSKTDAAISRPELDRPEIENRSDKEAPEAGASGGMQDESAIHPAANSQSSDQPLTGGGHVNDLENAATLNNRLDGVPVQPVKKPLRPLCRRPENCGGYGSTHCGSCIRASKQEEVAA